MRLAQQYGGGWEELLASARRAEILGFDGLWVNDGHSEHPGAFDPCRRSTPSARWRRLRRSTAGRHLGVAVFSAAYRPAALAARRPR